MAGRREFGSEILGGLEGLVVVDGGKELQRANCLFLGVQRQRRLMLGKALAVRILGIFFLQVTAVWQQDLAQVKSRLGAVNLSAKSLLDQ